MHGRNSREYHDDLSKSYKWNLFAYTFKQLHIITTIQQMNIFMIVEKEVEITDKQWNISHCIPPCPNYPPVTKKKKLSDREKE